MSIWSTRNRHGMMMWCQTYKKPSRHDDVVPDVQETVTAWWCGARRTRSSVTAWWCGARRTRNRHGMMMWCQTYKKPSRHDDVVPDVKEVASNKRCHVSRCYYLTGCTGQTSDLPVRRTVSTATQIRHFTAQSQYFSCEDCWSFTRQYTHIY
jgi:hypothetical protein